MGWKWQKLHPPAGPEHGSSLLPEPALSNFIYNRYWMRNLAATYLFFRSSVEIVKKMQKETAVFQQPFTGKCRYLANS